MGRFRAGPLQWRKALRGGRAVGAKWALRLAPRACSPSGADLQNPSQRGLEAPPAPTPRLAPRRPRATPPTRDAPVHRLEVDLPGEEAAAGGPVAAAGHQLHLHVAAPHHAGFFPWGAEGRGSGQARTRACWLRGAAFAAGWDVGGACFVPAPSVRTPPVGSTDRHTRTASRPGPSPSRTPPSSRPAPSPSTTPPLSLTSSPPPHRYRSSRPIPPLPPPPPTPRPIGTGGPAPPPPPTLRPTGTGAPASPSAAPLSGPQPASAPAGRASAAAAARARPGRRTFFGGGWERAGSRFDGGCKVDVSLAGASKLWSGRCCGGALRQFPHNRALGIDQRV